MSLIYALESAPPPRPATMSDLMSQIGAHMPFAKNEEIYGQGEAAHLVYRVLSGAVRTSRVMSDGRRPIGDFYFADDLFGLESGDHHPLAAEALSDCMILVASRSALITAGGEMAFAQMAWTSAARELDRSRRHLALLVRKTATERVASFMLTLAEGTNGGIVDLAISRQDIADYLGITIETVSRMLTQLQSRRVIRFLNCRQFCVNDLNALASLAAD